MILLAVMTVMTKVSTEDAMPSYDSIKIRIDSQRDLVATVKPVKFEIVESHQQQHQYPIRLTTYRKYNCKYVIGKCNAVSSYINRRPPVHEVTLLLYLSQDQLTLMGHTGTPFYDGGFVTSIKAVLTDEATTLLMLN